MQPAVLYGFKKRLQETIKILRIYVVTFRLTVETREYRKQNNIELGKKESSLLKTVIMEDILMSLENQIKKLKLVYKLIKKKQYNIELKRGQLPTR